MVCSLNRQLYVLLQNIALVRLLVARLDPPRCDLASSCHFILCSLLVVGGVVAQTPDGHTRFEVASIKPVHSHNAPYRFTGPNTGDLGRIIWSRFSLKELISDAYPEYGKWISGPEWIEDEYSLEATIPSGSTQRDVIQMVQNLLLDRFTLVQDKFGAKLGKEEPSYN